MNNAGMLVDRRLEAGHGDKVAIRCAGEQVTYAQLHERICAVGNTLSELGVGREDRVLMILDDSPTFPALFLGAMRMGAVPAPVSFLDTTDNFHHYARDSYAKLIVAEDALLERLPEGTMARSEFESRLISRRALARRHARRRHGLLAVQRRLDGLPEGRRAPAPRHRVHVRDVREGDPADHRERRHVLLDQALPRVRAGQQPRRSRTGWGRRRCCGPAGPTPKGLLETAAEQRPSLFFSVPTLYGAMVNLPDAGDTRPVERADVRLRRRAARARGAAPLAERASTSTSSTASARPRCSTSTARTAPATSGPGTSGKPVPGYELKLTDENGEPVPDGEVGNLHVRGDSALAYYWHQHEKTKAAINGEWFFTGDRYRVD